MKESLTIYEGTVFKGLFKKRPDKKYMGFIIVLKESIFVFQLVGKIGDKIVAVFGGGVDTSDQEYADNLLDDFQYRPGIEILESKIPCQTAVTRVSVVTKLKGPSKNVEPNLQFSIDNRLPQGYYFADIKFKDKEYQPVTQLKTSPGDAMAMQKLVGSKVAALSGNRLKSNFKLF